MKAARPVFRGRLVVGVLSHRVTQQSGGRGIVIKYILGGYPAVHILLTIVKEMIDLRN